MTVMYRQVPSDSRFAATGPFTRDEFNELTSDFEDLVNGFTPAGVFRSTADFVITFDGTDYYASSAYQTVYGGPDDTGGVDGAIFSDVINECLQDISDAGGGTILLDGAEFTSTKQILIPETLTPNAGQERCIEIRGTGGTVIKVDENLEAHGVYCDSATQYHMIRFVGFDVWHHAKDENYYAIYLKDVRVVYIRDVHVGWGGLYLNTVEVVHITNFEAVDSPNEGLKIEGGGYYWGVNIFIDNCGGNPLIADHSAVDITGSTRLQFCNMHIYGEKGNYGGQATGMYIYNTYSSNFANIHIQGFKSNALKIVGSHDLTFTGLHLNESDIYSDSHALEITSYTALDTYNISISDFNIYSGTAAMEGIAIYAQDSADVYDIQIANGKITSADDGIGISDDTGGAVCKDISISNVRISAASHGISEGGSTDYCVYTAVDARDCPDGIHVAGAHCKIQGCWNYTTWVPYTAA